MEVYLVSAVDPYTPKPSGTKTYILNLASYLSKKSIDITLIGISYRKSYADANLKFIPICFGKKISSFEFFIKLFIKTCFLTIRKNSIIHCQRAEDLIPFFLFHPRTPKILTVHDSHLINETILRHGLIVGSIIEFTANIGLRYADRIIAVNDEIKQICIQRDPSSKNKIVVNPPGVDLKIFRKMEKNVLRKKYGFEYEDKIILYVGRFDKEKRVDFLLRAFFILDSIVEKIKLVIVGDGPELNYLKSISGSNKNIIYLGTINHSILPEIMNCADVFALCSLREGMPTVVLEAMACGLPIVSTDVGDVKKIVKNDLTGYLVQSRDEIEFCEAINKAIINAENLSRNSVKIVKEYSIEKVIAQILTLYHEVLNKK